MAAPEATGLAGGFFAAEEVAELVAVELVVEAPAAVAGDGFAEAAFVGGVGPAFFLTGSCCGVADFVSVEARPAPGVLALGVTGFADGELPAVFGGAEFPAVADAADGGAFGFPVAAGWDRRCCAGWLAVALEFAGRTADGTEVNAPVFAAPDFGAADFGAKVFAAAGPGAAEFGDPDFSVEEFEATGFGAAEVEPEEFVPVGFIAGELEATPFDAGGPGATAPGAGLPEVASGFGGTVGKRSARMSTARIGDVSSGSACFSSTLVTTRTSSRRPRSAAGRTRILRKRSLPGETPVTVPTGKPFGKMPSPPLVTTSSPMGTVSSLMTFSRTTAPAGVPRRMPWSRDFSSRDPTPLV